MKCNSRSGFSILELSVVLTVIALVIGSALAVGATRIQAAKIQDTETKMKAISDVLDSFVQTYGYVPCPANPQALMTDSDFGDGTTDGAGNCTAQHLVGSGSNYRIGVIPTKTLKLAPSVMIDGWGRRISYVVDQRLTYLGDNLTKGYSGTAPDSVAGDFLDIYSTKTGATPVLVTNKAVVLFLSYGSDGHGAWRAKGGAATIQADPPPTDIDTLENANNDNAFVQKFRTETFDDVLSYRMQWQFPCVNTPDGANPYRCR